MGPGLFYCPQEDIALTARDRVHTPQCSSRHLEHSARCLGNLAEELGRETARHRLARKLRTVGGPALGADTGCATVGQRAVGVRGRAGGCEREGGLGLMLTAALLLCTGLS